MDAPGRLKVGIDVKRLPHNNDNEKSTKINQLNNSGESVANFHFIANFTMEINKKNKTTKPYEQRVLRSDEFLG
jgi:hypothetical protein